MAWSILFLLLPSVRAGASFRLSLPVVDYLASLLEVARVLPVYQDTWALSLFELAVDPGHASVKQNRTTEARMGERRRPDLEEKHPSSALRPYEGAFQIPE